MRRKQLEIVALTASTVIVAAILWFWVVQIREVLEVLSLAQGQ